VNNVETLCHVKHIADMGGEAYAKIGTPNNTGTRIFCVSGHVQRPGYYEFPAGTITMGQLLNEVCGGPLPGRKFKAVIPGGSSAKVLRFGETFKGKQKDGADMVDETGRRGRPHGLRHPRRRSAPWAAPAASS
jgi:NADH-quinone oxidoreductase subunit F